MLNRGMMGGSMKWYASSQNFGNTAQDTIHWVFEIASTLIFEVPPLVVL